MDRHYHIWYYVRSADGTINTLRRDPMEFETRRNATASLSAVRLGLLWPVILLTPALLPKCLYPTRTFRPGF